MNMSILTLWSDSTSPSAPGGHPGIFVGNLSAYPPVVTETMRRVLIQFDFAGQPAFAQGRCVHTPSNIVLITNRGRTQGGAYQPREFASLAADAAERMETDDEFSFNATFAHQFLKEITYA